MQSNRRRTHARNFGLSRSQLHGKRTRLVRRERSDKRSIDDGRACDRLLLPVHFPCGNDCSVEGYFDITLGVAIEFNQAHDDLVTLLRFLECQDSNPWIADLQ